MTEQITFTVSEDKARKMICRHSFSFLNEDKQMVVCWKCAERFILEPEEQVSHKSFKEFKNDIKDIFNNGAPNIPDQPRKNY